ncbi:hypothetical protein KDA_60270 [Dictyobacter alpinus]|uniref:Cytochrome P450 n=1 Tax=Dictyobacter alpinus TaxID=2014873 RepID=A0A402BGP5_9CHLR|nr:cytochrome P450 [Dictyobacter alpinus]GCE30543.1 hypothetical protein KDA_60270 [Dictyobacter alpinus]
MAQNIPTMPEASDGAGRCPIDHQALSRQKTGRTVEPVDLPIECDEAGVWHVRGFEEARFILRSGDTRQAGFNADQIADVKSLENKPILYQEGKIHQQQRKQTARFFTPKTVSTQYRQFMETLSDQLVEKVKREKQVDLSQLSLALAVQVAARVVGLTSSRLPGMDRRLDAFFHQSSNGPAPDAKSKPTLFDKIRQLLGQRQMLSFYFLDVQPAIKARKQKPQEDVISHLIGLKYSEPEILTECVTYAAAGMVTTREFISMAAWHFLEHPALRDRYLGGSEDERTEMLHEVLRIEPVVGNLYRRATADVTVQSQGKSFVIPNGALIDLHIYATNADQTVVGEEPLSICPERHLQGDRVASMLMGFGDGTHRCPGSFLAIQETDIFLKRLLALPNLSIERAPTLTWNDVSTGYELRKFILKLEDK